MSNKRLSRTFLRIPPKLSPTERRRLERVIGRFRRLYGVPAEAVVEVTVADDKLLTSLNERYRRRRGPTDVLAFPLGREPAEPPELWLWGDIYVSADRARAQAAERGVPLVEELAFLVAHGLLHLADFDHDTPAREAEMARAAAALLEVGGEE